MSHTYTVKFCDDCGSAMQKGHREVCPARIEAKGRPGYSPNFRRPESEADRLARRWGVSAGMQSGGGR